MLEEAGASYELIVMAFPPRVTLADRIGLGNLLSARQRDYWERLRTRAAVRRAIARQAEARPDADGA